MALSRTTMGIVCSYGLKHLVGQELHQISQKSLKLKVSFATLNIRLHLVINSGLYTYA
jgi:hypothetical protein